ncbi:MAG TPA: COX aromatic rich motif-containing protein [Candidatus Saccharimonadales bacterium]|nr:COX aromatic rich motif-containing protein [Candidatus Saccharimonadales bacterium]
MSKKYLSAIIFFSVLIIVELSFYAYLFLHNYNFLLLNPKGSVSTQQRDLLTFAALLASTIIIPVFLATFWIVWKYRSGNSQETPSSELHPRFKILWWALPSLIIMILAVTTWFAAHNLDPLKPISSSNKPLTIQVVALRWRWLFIYPEQKIATVNYVAFPTNAPVNFQLTADAPMNSFWIPQLGGQMYAMAGMQTQLHLMATSTGEFQGSAAEISGQGFAGMRFKALSSTQADFDTWVASVKNSSSTLSYKDYRKLASPSEDSKVVLYSSVEDNLFHQVMSQFVDAKK